MRAVRWWKNTDWDSEYKKRKGPYCLENFVLISRRTGLFWCKKEFLVVQWDGEIDRPTFRWEDDSDYIRGGLEDKLKKPIRKLIEAERLRKIDARWREKIPEARLLQGGT